MLHASIPSPTTGVWHLGPLPLRAYALCILAGIAVAVWVFERRWVARGGKPGIALDVAGWAVPFGIVGGRLYHVVTTPEPYWGRGGHPVDALKIWQGGLGIWGAIAFGGLGAWIACRRRGDDFRAAIDAAAPGVVLAQAFGRWGNYFNNELYGRRTDLPWALQVHEWDQGAGHAVRDASGHAVVLGTFHPTFLYESLWCVFVAGAIVLAERWWKLDRGRVFALYVALYTLGRGYFESLRIDRAERILGLRLNEWTSLVVFLGAVAYIVVVTLDSRRAHAPHTVADATAPSHDPDASSAERDSKPL